MNNKSKNTLKLMIKLALIISCTSFITENPSKIFIQNNSIEIKSIASENFSDLQFLKPILKDKKVVYLGESSHYTKEFSKMKTRIVKFLNKELGFEILALESPMGEINYFNFYKKSSEDTVLKYGTLSFFHTEEIKEVFKYANASNDLKIFGIDIQLNSLKTLNSYLRSSLKEYVSDNEVEYFIKKDSVFIFSNQKEKEILRENLIQSYNIIEGQIKARSLNSFNEKTDFLIKLIENKKYLTSCYGRNYSSSTRDSLMAENLRWLIKKRFETKKIIVWAHNYHVLKNYPSTYISNSKIMGAILNKEFNSISYTIGLYCNSGRLLVNNSELTVKKPRKNSLEYLINQSGYDYTFFDFSKINDFKNCSWVNNPIEALYSGFRVKDRLIPKESYDAIIQIKEVNPSKILY